MRTLLHCLIIKMSTASIISIAQLKKLDWDALAPITSAKIDGQRCSTDAVVAFGCESSVKVFVDPQGMILTLPMPVTLGQLLKAVQRGVEKADDCVWWGGITQVDKEKCGWEDSACYDGAGAPDYIIELRE
jgi:hypothetical protein